MRLLIKGAVVAMVAGVSVQASAYEFGANPGLQKPGVTLGGSSAGVPPPGIYMFQQFYTYQANIVGPGAPNNGRTRLSLAAEGTGILFVPGWTFLGATYDAVLVQPVAQSSIGDPVNVSGAGLHNTYINPMELSWRLGDSGVFVKVGTGFFAPDGTITGPNGLGDGGNPWWTFDPDLTVSYLKDGWNLTGSFYLEMNTRNTITKYRSGDVLHAEFAATKRIGNWTVGPVGYYIGQVTDDSSSAFYRNAINVDRYNIWAAGPLVGYDFGPVAVNVWAPIDIAANASGPIPGTATIVKGWNVFASLSFRLWGPDKGDPASALTRLIHK